MVADNDGLNLCVCDIEEKGVADEEVVNAGVGFTSLICYCQMRISGFLAEVVCSSRSSM